MLDQNNLLSSTGASNPLLAFISLVLWVCNNTLNAVILGMDIGTIAELIKVMVPISCSIMSTLFLYVINRKTINEWYKQQAEVRWLKRIKRKTTRLLKRKQND